MESLGLLVGHLIGDYILQNDWQAQNKSNPLSGKSPGRFVEDKLGVYYQPGDPVAEATWHCAIAKSWMGHLACTVHCLLYTLAVWTCSFWWMPLWGVVVCFLAHWPVDRFRLAWWWMNSVSGQAAFAKGPSDTPASPFWPWSIIVVDNTFHLLVLFIIGVIHGDHF